MTNSTAICTYCGKELEWENERWEHVVPECDNPICCKPVQFATPRRGSIKKVA